MSITRTALPLILVSGLLTTLERELLAELGHPDPYACDDEEPPSKEK